LPLSRLHFAVFEKQGQWIRSTIPLILFNKSIGFAKRFQWICFRNLPLLLLCSVIFAACFPRFSL